VTPIGVLTHARSSDTRVMFFLFRSVGSANITHVSKRYTSRSLTTVLLDDGLHPNLEGQKRIVRALVAHLTLEGSLSEARRLTPEV